MKRPLNKGVVDVLETPGCIIIKYRFFPAEIEGNEEFTAFEAEFEKYEKATFQFSSCLKGYLKHNSKNRTNVKVDYVDLKIHSDDITPSDFSKILKTMNLG